MTENYTLVVEKWQIRPIPCWIPLKEYTVFGRATPKRITITQGLHKGKLFDRATGAAISRKSRSYRYSLKMSRNLGSGFSPLVTDNALELDSGKH